MNGSANYKSDGWKDAAGKSSPARSVYLALGDSITLGYEATHPAKTFVSQVGNAARKKSIAKRIVVVARNGWTARDLYNAARWIPPDLWDTTNLVTLMVGGNDLRKRYYALWLTGDPDTAIHRGIDEFALYMDRLCEWIYKKRIPHVLVSTVYNPVPNAPIAVRSIEKLNETIRESATKYKFRLVDVYEAFKGKEPKYINRYRSGRLEDLAVPFRRPIHPNNAGHRCIAELLNKHLA